MRIFTPLLTTAFFAWGAVATKYHCDDELSLCFAETHAENDAYFRMAIPQNAIAPFDVVLQMEAPKSVGWLGFAWAGERLNSPVTLAWPSGRSVAVISQHVTEHDLPRSNTKMNTTLLRGSYANETHWKANILCHGCSSWEYAGGLKRALNVSEETTWFMWTDGKSAPKMPLDPLALFRGHSRRGFLSLVLKDAQQNWFAAAVEAARPTTTQVAKKIGEEAIEAAHKFGAEALKAVEHAGKEAIRAAEVAGVAAIQAAHEAAKAAIVAAHQVDRPASELKPSSSVPEIKEIDKAYNKAEESIHAQASGPSLVLDPKQSATGTQTA